MKRPQFFLGLIVVAYIVYAALFILRTSAVVERTPDKFWVPETRRYFVLFDDMMISMRYARNLAEGHGLVWNPEGERIEGFTNPLWVGYMAFIALIEHDAAQTSLYVQATGALFLIANLLIVWQIAGLVGRSGWVRVGAVLFTAVYLPLNTWSLQGTEVSVLTLLLSTAVWLALRQLAAGRFGLWPYLLLGFSTLIRMDMAVPLVLLSIFLFFADMPHRFRHLLAGPLLVVIFLGPLTAFRLWYYGEWFPNTYYLKLVGYPFVLRVLHGLDVTLRVFIKLGALPFLVFVFRRDRLVRLPAWMFLGQVLYSIYTGGDAWEWYGGANRYVSIGMPLFFVLLACALEEIYSLLMIAGQQSPRRVNPVVARTGLLAFALFLLISYNAIYGPGALAEWLLLKPSLDAGDNGRKVEQALWLDRYTAPSATVALAGAGIIPYFTERTYIDLLGKNDPVIARLPMDQTVIPELKPGHMKWDYAYSIGEIQPDVVLELWINEPDALQYLNAADGAQVTPRYLSIWCSPCNGAIYMRSGSPRVWWELIFGSQPTGDGSSAARSLQGDS